MFHIAFSPGNGLGIGNERALVLEFCRCTIDHTYGLACPSAFDFVPQNCLGHSDALVRLRSLIDLDLGHVDERGNVLGVFVPVMLHVVVPDDSHSPALHSREAEEELGIVRLNEHQVAGRESRTDFGLDRSPVAFPVHNLHLHIAVPSAEFLERAVAESQFVKFLRSFPYIAEPVAARLKGFGLEGAEDRIGAREHSVVDYFHAACVPVAGIGEPAGIQHLEIGFAHAGDYSAATGKVPAPNDKLEILLQALFAVRNGESDLASAGLERHSRKFTFAEFQTFRKASVHHLPIVSPVGHAGEVVIGLLPRHQSRSGSNAEFQRCVELGGCVDYQPLLSVTDFCSSAILLNDLHCYGHCPVDDVLYGCVREVVAGHIYVPVIERLGPVCKWHRPGSGHRLASVDDSEDAAGGGSLVVGVESEGATYVQGLLNVAFPIEQGKHTHSSVQVGIPDGPGE